ncbi:hypothetical protein CP533_5209, partial [Ophiocordyceps camponoti-saundersi (nom. inval.)]
MLYHWPTTACQAVVFLFLLWPINFISASPVNSNDDTYYLDDDLPFGFKVADPTVTDPPAEPVFPLPAKKTSGHSPRPTPTSSTASADREEPTPSTSGTQSQSRWSLGFLRPRFGEMLQDGVARGSKSVSAVNRVMVFLGGVCASVPAEDSDSSSSDDEETEEVDFVPPRAREIQANMTLYFGPLRLYPSFTRRLPAPQPTAYSQSGVPQFEYWYAWQPKRDWRNTPNRAFQLIPKAAGVYRPPRGAIGSLLHVCTDRQIKDPRRGWPPSLPGFPGALASGWYFELPESGHALMLYDKTSTFARSYEERPAWYLDRVERLFNFLELTGGPDVERVRVLVFEIFLFVLPRVPGGVLWRDFRHVRVMAEMIFTYAPHFGEILLRFYYMLLYRAKRESSEAAAETSAKKLPKFADQLANSLENTLELYTVPENGLYVDCNSTASDPDNLMLGSWSKEHLCSYYSSVSQLSTLLDAVDWTPSLAISCRPPTDDGNSCQPKLGSNVTVESFEITAAVIEAHEVPHIYPENDMDEDYDSFETNRTASTQGPSESDNGCSEFSELKFGIQLDGGERSSTRDSIYLSINNHEEILIAESPWSGYHRWMDIDTFKEFKRGRFTVRDIRYISLISKIRDDRWDGWGVQGVKLRAKCADSTTQWGVDKFANIHHWMDRGNSRLSSTVWHGNISPRDWHEITIQDSCDSFEKLQISVHQSPVGKGSQDRIFISFGMEGKQSVERKIHKNGDQDWQSIDIQNMWNTPTVGLDQIDHVQIKQLHVGDVKNRVWAVF